MIEVLRAGPQTTLQDGGRQAWRDRGLSRCGALDDLALQQANLLVGNSADAAALEITLGPAALRFHEDAWVALTGTDVPADLGGRMLRPGWRALARAGDTLRLTAPQQRMRSYVAVSGGIDVPIVLGSRSTDLKAGFGGGWGRALKDGDRLPLGPAARWPQRPAGLRVPEWRPVLRVLPGPEVAEFEPDSLAAFFATAWRVSPQSNRMGYRLTGPVLRRRAGLGDLPSHGVLPGVIQVPPAGQPIVLLADCQTTGGYPKIGIVIQADLWQLAQAPLGSLLRFEPCEPEAALAALRQRRHALQQLASALTIFGP